MKKTLNVCIIFLFIAGSAVLLYPTISSFITGREQSVVVKDYDESVKSRQQIENEKELEKAGLYNQTLGKMIIKDPFSINKNKDEEKEYQELLDIEGVMGYIEVPKIQLQIPIYHGTSEEVLEKGSGHLYGSSLPVGGSSTNTVLTGHRGLPKAKLFTDLDKIEKGDKIYIHVLDKTLAYEVKTIKVIEPYELDDLNIKSGQDMVTLFTCTPYGINSHRLVIQGERINMDSSSTLKESETKMLSIRKDNFIFIGAIAAFIFIVAIIFIYIYKHIH
ncbi:class C sortase [Clostridium cadaveris]|uniref:class C sortase n=1 Tax=Clostridium cadaveris TaxID=1529 RepID=UPI0015B4AB3A|nr:class C sortase [Clostridium cadaveris]NWK12057.1 class C sortase [Clostridium cadaveris]